MLMSSFSDKTHTHTGNILHKSHPNACKLWQSLPLIGQSESVNMRLLQQAFCQSLERLEQAPSLPPGIESTRDCFESSHYLETHPCCASLCHVRLSTFKKQPEQQAVLTPACSLLHPNEISLITVRIASKQQSNWGEATTATKNCRTKDNTLSYYYYFFKRYTYMTNHVKVRMKLY